MAELETAAVTAFVQLADELEAHGLPQFASYALKAAEQEVRHAHDVTRLALSLGHCPRPHTLHPTGLRSLDEVALDNAGEGCGRELMGAVINAHQAKTAGNPLVRKTMAGIADDEREHAGFSFELAGALMPRLSASQRRRAREAQEQTLAQLSSDELPQSTRALLGLMNPDQLKTAAGRLLEGWRL